MSQRGAGPRGAPPAVALGLRLARHWRDFILRRHPPAAPPYRLWVDLTSRCNLACPACPQRLLDDGQRRDMDEGLLEELSRQAGAWGCQVSLFHRGEPLLHPRFDHWIARFRQAGATVRLHTNATLLDQERARRLLAAPPDLLTISLDTLDPTDYALARPGAELGRTLANLEGLLRGRGGRVLPRISLLLMGRQRGGPEARARLARLKALGLERVIWRAPHNWGGSVPAGTGQVGVAPRRPAVCTFPWYGLAVLSDGRVSPCPQDFRGGMTLGRAQEQSLEEIWRGRAYGELRRDLAARRLDQRPVCMLCDRIRRPTLLGLPTEHLKNILAESIVEPRGGAKWSLRRRSE